MKVQVILGSTREGRFGEQPAKWIMSKLQEKGIEAELLDLRDYPMPFFDMAKSPSMGGVSDNEFVQKWTAKVAEGDAYIFIAAEYNHGYTAVLKNALDFVYKEWNNKPAAIISYGGPAAGTRAAQQLKQVFLELQIFPLRNNIHLPFYWEHLNEKGEYDFSRSEHGATALIEQLNFWGEKLASIRSEMVATA